VTEIKFSIYGDSPEISQIGAIWTSTLVAMNALRPFTSQEIAALGDVMADLVGMCDVAIGNEEDADNVFGIKLKRY
jgi:hypothetical protein